MNTLKKFLSMLSLIALLTIVSSNQIVQASIYNQPVTLKSIKTSVDTIPIQVGTNISIKDQISVQAKYSNNSTSNITYDNKLIWSIQNASIAKLPNNGTIKGLKEGITTLNLTYKGLTAKITILVFGSKDLVNYSKKFLGTNYIYGGNTPKGFDCSGFTQYTFGHFGIRLPRTALEQSTVGTPVTKENLKPGDLIFFGKPVYHVGIYIGNGQFIHSPKTGDVVKITELKYMQGSVAFNCARRIFKTNL